MKTVELNTAGMLSARSSRNAFSGANMVWRCSLGGGRPGGYAVVLCSHTMSRAKVQSSTSGFSGSCSMNFVARMPLTE